MMYYYAYMISWILSSKIISLFGLEYGLHILLKNISWILKISMPKSLNEEIDFLSKFMLSFI